MRYYSGPPSLVSSSFTGQNLTFASDSFSRSNVLLHPSSNRIVVTSLSTAHTSTLPFETRSNIKLVSSSSSAIVTVDTEGLCVCVSLVTGAVIGRMNLQSSAVSCAVFSPCGQVVAFSVDKKIFLYSSPSLCNNFTFLLLKVYVGHPGSVTALSFPSERELLSASQDGSVRLWDLRPALSGTGVPQHVVFTDQIHSTVGVFMVDEANLVSLSRTAFLVHYVKGDASWSVEAKAQLRLPNEASLAGISGTVANVTGVAFQQAKGVMVVSFSTGVFALYELPSLAVLQSFSLGSTAVPKALSLGGDGEWVGLGLSNGGVAVYEWKSESFILRTGGIVEGGVSCVACAPKLRRTTALYAVGTHEGSIRLYEEQSGFNFATFKQHSAGITSMVFISGALVSASLDGSIRAFDLGKLNNFRTFTRDTAGCASAGWRHVAVDEAGEVVAGASGGGGEEMGSIWLWSMKTGQVLERLAGHESVITGIGFLSAAELVSTSLTDRSVRVWKYMEGGVPETTVLARDAVAMSVGEGEVAIATTAGKIFIYSQGRVSLEIEGGRDIVTGRSKDSVTASNKFKGKKFTAANTHFISLTWVGGRSLIAAVAKDSPYVYLYDTQGGALLQRLKICGNRSIDGIQSFLNSKKDTKNAADSLAVDDYDGLTGMERKKRRIAEEDKLPGVQLKNSWQVSQVASTPDGSSLAIATSEGAFIFHSEHTQRDRLLFRPAVIDADVNLKRIDELYNLYSQTQETKYLAQVLATSLALNHQDSLTKALLTVPVANIPQYISTCVASELLQPLVFFLANALQPGSSNNHVELLLMWADALMSNHWRDIQALCAKNSDLLAAMQSLTLALNSVMTHLGGLFKKNAATLEFLANL